MAVEKEYNGVTYIISNVYLRSKEDDVKRGDTRVIGGILLVADEILGGYDIKTWFRSKKSPCQVSWKPFIPAEEFPNFAKRDKDLAYVKKYILGLDL